MTKLACNYIYTVHLYMCSYMYIWKKVYAEQAKQRVDSCMYMYVKL